MNYIFPKTRKEYFEMLYKIVSFMESSKIIDKEDEVFAANYWGDTSLKIEIANEDGLKYVSAKMKDNFDIEITPSSKEAFDDARYDSCPYPDENTKETEAQCR